MMNNLGGMEILILLFLGGLLVGILAGVVFLVLFLIKRHGAGRVAELEAENRRLREELDRQRGRA